MQSLSISYRLEPCTIQYCSSTVQYCSVLTDHAYYFSIENETSLYQDHYLLGFSFSFHFF